MASDTSEKQFCINCGKEMQYNWVARKWTCDECQISQDGPPPLPPSASRRIQISENVVTGRRLVELGIALIVTGAILAGLNEEMYVLLGHRFIGSGFPLVFTLAGIFVSVAGVLWSRRSQKA